MKMTSLAVIVSGALCLLVAFGETLSGYRFLKVEPIKLILLATAVFLLGIAVMCYDRFYGSTGERH